MSVQYTPEYPASVYLIRLCGSDYYKVGVSGNVHARLASLQTANPFDLMLVASFVQRDATIIEFEIHQALSAYRVRDEWFRCEYEEIVKVFNDYNAMGIVDGGLEDSSIPPEILANYLLWRRDIRAPSREALIASVVTAYKTRGEALNVSQEARQLGISRALWYKLRDEAITQGRL